MVPGFGLSCGFGPIVEHCSGGHGFGVVVIIQRALVDHAGHQLDPPPCPPHLLHTSSMQIISVTVTRLLSILVNASHLHFFTISRPESLSATFISLLIALAASIKHWPCAALPFFNMQGGMACIVTVMHTPASSAEPTEPDNTRF